jgi:hypothetical protein
MEPLGPSCLGIVEGLSQRRHWARASGIAVSIADAAIAKVTSAVRAIMGQTAIGQTSKQG